MCLKNIHEKLGGVAGAIVSYDGYRETAKHNNHGSDVPKFVDGWLMPDGRFVVNRVLRHNFNVSGHGDSALFLGADGNECCPVSDAMKKGFIRFSRYAREKTKIQIVGGISLIVEPTKEQYEFVETLDFDNGFYLNVCLRKRTVMEDHEQPISGVAVADAIKAFFAKGCLGGVFFEV
jgi:hypothetical protein